jgi:hypothetical protein
MATSRHLASNPYVELMPWEPTDEDCVLCDEPYSPLGGIDTTDGWLCYACAKWVKRLAGELPDFDSGKNWRAEIDSTP